ncbi:phosphotransferase family protein [Deinococcus maricopensis]|nr:phosphotransferase [Deinococcus maricopensis]
MSAVTPATFPTLQAKYGPLTPVDAGMQSRVYAAGDVVVKVYRNQRGEHRTEAANMTYAGFRDRIIDVLEADGVEVLVTRRFPGHALRPDDVPRAHPHVAAFIRGLHAHREGPVDLARLHERLRRFRSALAPYPLDDLFDAIEGPLARGVLDVPAAFCHLDLWQDNILINDATGEVLIIDWTRAAADDPLRDIALYKTGTLDLLPPDDSLRLATQLVPDEPHALLRLRAYLAHTYLHDLYWFLMNEPYAFEPQLGEKVPRARHALARLPEE